MGSDTIVASIIMFIVVISLATLVSASLKVSVEDSTNSMVMQSKIASNEMKTNFRIASMSYNNNTEEIRVSALNIGKTILNIEQIDIFVNGEFISRNDTERQIYVEPSTDNKNTGLWDPTETLTIIVKDKIFFKNDDINILIITQYGSKEEDNFIVVNGVN
jgi:archaellum component FlaF (FlaF/FlaG flagellin family)